MGRPLTREDVSLIEKRCRYIRDKLLIRCFGQLQLRASEAISLEVSQVNFKKGYIITTTGRRRLDRRTRNLFKQYITRGGPVVKDGKRLIFGINRHRAWQIIQQVAEEAGIPKLINQDSGKVHKISPERIREVFKESRFGKVKRRIR